MKKWKKCLEISFYTSVSKIMTICYTVPEIWCVMDAVFIFHFGLFFALLAPLPKASKIKILEKRKKPWKYQYYRNYTCVSKILIPGCICHNLQLLRYGAPWRDGQIDGETGRQIKWHREVSAPPKKYWYRH